MLPFLFRCLLGQVGPAPTGACAPARRRRPSHRQASPHSATSAPAQQRGPAQHSAVRRAPGRRGSSRCRAAPPRWGSPRTPWCPAGAAWRAGWRGPSSPPARIWRGGGAAQGARSLPLCKLWCKLLPGEERWKVCPRGVKPGFRGRAAGPIGSALQQAQRRGRRVAAAAPPPAPALRAAAPPPAPGTCGPPARHRTPPASRRTAPCRCLGGAGARAKVHAHLPALPCCMCGAVGQACPLHRLPRLAQEAQRPLSAA